jgi:hypothetical protein
MLPLLSVVALADAVLLSVALALLLLAVVVLLLSLSDSGPADALHNVSLTRINHVCS